MNGIKLYALLGSLSLMTACIPQMTLAAQPDQKPASGDAGQFNELKQQQGGKRSVQLNELFSIYGKAQTTSTSPKGETRSMSIDALFQSFKNESTATTAPVAHSTVAEHHKTAVAHSNHKQPAIATTPTGKTGTKPGGKAEVAIYKHTPTEADAVVAVAHQVISHGSTPVISASLDRPGTVPKYRSGDHMVVNLKALQDCKVLVFDYDNEGTITQLWPNSFEPDGTLAAGQTVQIGGDSSKYTLDIDGKGLEQIFIYTYPSSEKLPGLEMAFAPVANTPFRSARMTKAQYDRLISSSQEYFQSSPAPATADSRSIKVVAKDGASPAAFANAPANKVELTFQIEK